MRQNNLKTNPKTPELRHWTNLGAAYKAAEGNIDRVWYRDSINKEVAKLPRDLDKALKCSADCVEFYVEAEASKPIYILKIRWSGEEDDVFLFSTKQKALAYVKVFFEDELDAYREENPPTITFEEWVEDSDVGYFDILEGAVDAEI